VLLSQRDLLEARTVLIETKQQQLSAIVNAYQALGGGYLLSSDGRGFDELFCHPPLVLSDEAVMLPMTVVQTEQPTPSEEVLPLAQPTVLPTPGDEVEPLPPVEQAPGNQ
jgi:outer membrane protein, multidrug efflux system